MAAVAILLVACFSAKVGGDVTVNGEALRFDACRNGVLYGYRGVEVTAKNGLRLRIATTQTGAADLVVMPPGAATGTDLGPCGVIDVSDQHSSVNNVTNVEGHADLDCASDGFTIHGRVTFENCH